MGGRHLAPPGYSRRRVGISTMALSSAFRMASIGSTGAGASECASTAHEAASLGTGNEVERHQRASRGRLDPIEAIESGSLTCVGWSCASDKGLSYCTNAAGSS